MFSIAVLVICGCSKPNDLNPSAKSETKAFKQYQKAADAGDADAMVIIGVYYLIGAGVSQSDTEAFKWCKKAAEQGNAKAQALTGFMYYDGIGVKKTLKKP